MLKPARFCFQKSLPKKQRLTLKHLTWINQKFQETKYQISNKYQISIIKKTQIHYKPTHSTGNFLVIDILNLIIICFLSLVICNFLPKNSRK